MFSVVAIISPYVISRKNLKFVELHFRSMGGIRNFLKRFNFSYPQKLDCVHETAVHVLEKKRTKSFHYSETTRQLKRDII